MPSAVVSVVAVVHDDARVVEPTHSPMVEGRRGFEVSKGAAEPDRVSLVSGLIVCEVFHAPVDVSFVATGTGTTEGVMVELAVRPAESVSVYCTGVAVPVKAPVHDAPDGVLTAEHGVNVTTPAADTA